MGLLAVVPFSFLGDPRAPGRELAAGPSAMELGEPGALGRPGE